jgi:hypothetical protein
LIFLIFKKLEFKKSKGKKKIQPVKLVSIYTQVDNQWVSVADSNNYTTMGKNPSFREVACNQYNHTMVWKTRLESPSLCGFRGLEG